MNLHFYSTMNLYGLIFSLYIFLISCNWQLMPVHFRLLVHQVDWFCWIHMCHCWSIRNTQYHMSVCLLKQARDSLEKRTLEHYLCSICLSMQFLYFHNVVSFFLLLIIKNSYDISVDATWNVIFQNL